MRKFFSYRFNDFIADRLQWGSVLFSVVLFALHYYQFCDSGHLIEPLVRMIFCISYPFVIFLCGRKCIAYLFLIFAYTTELFSHFQNYTSFIIILLFTHLHPKMKITVFLLYLVDIVITCTWHDKSVIHLSIHLMNCAFFYFVFQFVVQFATNKIRSEKSKLILDDKDRNILEQIADGAKQKEIDDYSENTVSKRLKAMRERNNCKTNEELIMRFISEIQ